MEATALPQNREDYQDYFLGNYFAREDYIATDVKTGVARDREGSRIISLNNDFLVGFHRGLLEECGPAAWVVLKTCGQVWGERFGKRLDKNLSQYYGYEKIQDMPFGMFEKLFCHAFRVHGWGFLGFDHSLIERGLVIFEVREPIMGSVFSHKTHPVDSLLSGVFAGIFSHYASRELDCLQTSCITQEAEKSLFVLTAANRLDEGERWVEKGMKHDDILAELVDGQE